MLGDLIVVSAGPILITVDKGHCMQAVLERKVRKSTRRGIDTWKCMLQDKLKSVQNIGILYPSRRPVCQVHLGFCIPASAQVHAKPALVLGAMFQYTAQSLICITTAKEPSAQETHISMYVPYKQGQGHRDHHGQQEIIKTIFKRLLTISTQLTNWKSLLVQGLQAGRFGTSK